MNISWYYNFQPKDAGPPQLEGPETDVNKGKQEQKKTTTHEHKMRAQTVRRGKPVLLLGVLNCCLTRDNYYNDA